MYASELRNLSKTCNYGDITESLIRDRIVNSIKDEALHQRCLREDGLTLQTALHLIRTAEATTARIQTMSEPVTEVHAVQAGGRRKSHSSSCTVRQRHSQQGAASQGSSVESSHRQSPGGRNSAASGSHHASSRRSSYNNTTCSRCGGRHARGRCPAHGKRCNACGGMNHFAKVCRGRRATSQHKSHSNESSSNVHNVQLSEAIQDFHIDTVSHNDTITQASSSAINQSSQCNDWMVTVNICGSLIPMKLDTGAQANILKESDYYCLKHRPKLLTHKQKLSSYTGDEIPVKGSCIVKIKNVLVLCFVVPGDVQSILGLKSAESLGYVPGDMLSVCLLYRKMSKRNQMCQIVLKMIMMMFLKA